VGKDMPELAQIWHQYLRRFAIDHWYRFIKQRLHWTVPHFATPEQSERWSDLIPQLTWQLWLARTCADDCPLPWQQPSNNPTISYFEFFRQALPLFFSTNDHNSSAAIASVSTSCTRAL
jgi:hypothetical protein